MKTGGKHATVSEVAKRAGVGTTTVSRVINGGQNVDPKTLARVQRAIDQLGYLPNQAARALKGDRTRAVGFVIPSIADPFFSSCAEAAQAVVRAHGSLLIVLTTQNEAAAEGHALNELLRHRVDGIILAPARKHRAQLREVMPNPRIPMVALDRPLAGSAIPCVMADHYQGSLDATRHLIAHGYRRILCLTGETELYTIQERIRGYRDAISEAGLPTLVDSSIQDHESTERAFENHFHREAPPDAIFTLKNSTTMDTFETLQRHSVSIPDEVALLGFDDFSLAEMVRPSVSVVQQPVEELGRVAAQLLFAQMIGSQAAEGEQTPVATQLDTRLILRTSCGCPLQDSAAPSYSNGLARRRAGKNG